MILSILDHITDNLKHDQLVRMVFIMLLMGMTEMMTEMMMMLTITSEQDDAIELHDNLAETDEDNVNEHSA